MKKTTTNEWEEEEGRGRPSLSVVIRRGDRPEPRPDEISKTRDHVKDDA